VGVVMVTVMGDRDEVTAMSDQMPLRGQHRHANTIAG